MQLSDERLDLLIDCLSFAPELPEPAALRAKLLGDARAMQAMLDAASRRQLGSLVLDTLHRRGIVPLSDRPSGAAPFRGLAAARHEFTARRAALREGLLDIVAALNARGIAPLLMKGAVSLWTGEPDWRFQRDIDIRVDPGEAIEATRALEAIGFAVVENPALGAQHHHLQPMARADLPAFVEIHVGLGGARAEGVLPHAEFVAAAQEETRAPGAVRLLRPHHFALHGLVHHHFQNRGAVHGTLSLKGLCEFAHAVAAMTADDAQRMAACAAQEPRLAAGLALWCAACRRVLGLALPHALAPDAAAQARLERIMVRYMAGVSAGRAAALTEELAAVWRARRPVPGRRRSVIAAWAEATRDAVQAPRFARYGESALRASGVIADL